MVKLLRRNNKPAKVVDTYQKPLPLALNAESPESRSATLDRVFWLENTSTAYLLVALGQKVVNGLSEKLSSLNEVCIGRFYVPLRCPVLTGGERFAWLFLEVGDVFGRRAFLAELT